MEGEPPVGLGGNETASLLVDVLDLLGGIGVEGLDPLADGRSQSLLEILHDQMLSTVDLYEAMVLTSKKVLEIPFCSSKALACCEALWKESRAFPESSCALPETVPESS